ncbi:Similar to neurl4: Neuralized-like protein 4 (Xenopus tropicalis) [Cotesia congregata]|uniref:Similar to neurl4: Neuralized-like protein 4 (Xenopus tropicalis) n=1 Tax=Cotesia congregata TaxID=51543 RepID=A0A8J2MFD5_COTCN|nr:Similar to neurl4: Neuralized-like protein 4 (Xenopus tropicalis) [Cotesia congregata]
MSSSCNSDSNSSTSKLEITNEPPPAAATTTTTELECFKFENNNINNHPYDTYDNNTMSNNNLSSDNDNHDEQAMSSNMSILKTANNKSQCNLMNSQLINHQHHHQNSKLSSSSTVLPYQSQKSLVLPNEFFLLDEIICYCNSCYKVDSDGATCKEGDLPTEFAVPIRWVSFLLKQTINTNQIPQSTTDKWIIDHGELLPIKQLDFSNLTTIFDREDQNPQFVFSPNIKYIDIQSNKKLNASMAFQLLVKSGSYMMDLDKQHGVEPIE